MPNCCIYRIPLTSYFNIIFKRLGRGFITGRGVLNVKCGYRYLPTCRFQFFVLTCSKARKTGRASTNENGKSTQVSSPSFGHLQICDSERYRAADCGTTSRPSDDSTPLFHQRLYLWRTSLSSKYNLKLWYFK